MSNILNETYTLPTASKDNWQTCNIAMDIGSTQTRSAAYDAAANISDSIILDSNFEIFTRDISHAASPSDTLIGNLDMIITDETAGQKVRPRITTEHVIKGDLLSAITTETQITGASVSKVDQKATYINAISNVAIVLLQQFAERGKTEEIVNVNMTISLPPEDTKNISKLKVFRESLAGTYSVEFIRLGITVKFTIPENIKIISEPESVAVYLSVNNALEDEDDAVVCVLDIGGRSTGITFISNKHLLVDNCATVNKGGSQLAAITAREIASAYNIQEPEIPRVMRSLATGTFKIGAQKLDVSEQINAAKTEFAASIVNELIRAVDNNTIQLQSISNIYCSGRTFMDAPKSPSLMTFIEREYKTKSAYTAFKRIEEINPILTGLCYTGIMNGKN